MSYRLVIRPTVNVDIIEAAAWYEKQQSGIGVEFAAEIRTAIRGLAENPLQHPIRVKRKSIRWFVAPRFPYKIIYRIEADSVVVFTVVHTARDDRVWMKKI